MYQTVGGSLLPALAQCAGLPLYRQPIRGQALQTGLDYAPSDTGDEVEDLTALLQRVVAADPAVRGVSVGAIASDYQRVRVESVCARLGLTPLCYLWRADQDALLSRMLDAGVEAVLCKVACMGLKPARDLGRQLADMAPTLRRLHAEFGAHICGEGGEFETFTLACPLFPRRLVLDATRARTLGEDETISPVGILEVTRWHVEDVPDEYWDGARAVEPRSPAPRRCGAEERTRHAVEATDNSAQGWRLSGESLSPAAAPAPAAVPAAVQTSSGHGWIAVTVRACTPEGLSAESPSASAQATSAAIDALARRAYHGRCVPQRHHAHANLPCVQWTTTRPPTLRAGTHLRARRHPPARQWQCTWTARATRCAWMPWPLPPPRPCPSVACTYSPYQSGPRA